MDNLGLLPKGSLKDSQMMEYKSLTRENGLKEVYEDFPNFGTPPMTQLVDYPSNGFLESLHAKLRHCQKISLGEFLGLKWAS